MKRLPVIALLALLLAGCATRREPPYDGKIFDDNLRGTGPGWVPDQSVAGPPMPPSELSPEIKKAVAVERKRQVMKYRATTPEHGRLVPGDTNRFVGPLPPPKL